MSAREYAEHLLRKAEEVKRTELFSAHSAAQRETVCVGSAFPEWREQVSRADFATT